MEGINRTKVLAALGLLAFFALFVHSLGAILTPFVTAALLAYLGDPLVDRLEKLRLGRTLSVLLVFIFFTLIFVALFLFFGPLLSDQLQDFVQKLPEWTNRAAEFALPYLQDWGVMGQGELNREAIKGAVTNYWKEGGNLALNAIGKISSSGAAVLGVVSNIVLIPVLTFYLLRDWDIIVAKLKELLPRPSEKTVVGIVLECDEVLSSFLRGQLVVMFSLGIIYSLGLSVIGLDLALLIGTLAGLFSIIPYMGFAVGIVAAAVAAWMQFHDPTQLIYVAIVFGIGQALEGMFLTPNLVGDKIGLHPVAVIFALMAGAQLFGFVGLLLALPIAAMLMVLVRYFTKQYKKSQLYLKQQQEQSQHAADQNLDASQTVAEVNVNQQKRDADFSADLEKDSVFDDAIWMKKVDE